MIHTVADDTGFFQLNGEGLPDDTLTQRFRAVERVSSLYEVIVDFSTQDPNFDVSSLLRKQLTLLVMDAGDGRRVFDGVVEEATFVDIVAERLCFRVRLRPALASLAHRQSSRIFQEQSVVAIIQTLFEEAGFGDNVQWPLAEMCKPQPSTSTRPVGRVAVAQL